MPNMLKQWWIRHVIRPRQFWNDVSVAFYHEALRIQGRTLLLREITH